MTKLEQAHYDALKHNTDFAAEKAARVTIAHMKGFLEYAADNGWYRNGKDNAEWYQIPKQSINKSTEELIEQYLKQLP